MTNRQFTLRYLNADSVVELRTIRESDQSLLREWKNQHRQSFFFKELITKSAQQQWFDKYLARDDDFLFVVRVENSRIGCMGIRMFEDRWDVYNVILGDSKFSKQGYMRQALRLMCTWALQERPQRITAKVLAENPAMNWYCRNGFGVVFSQADHVEIALDQSAFVRCVLILLD